MIVQSKAPCAGQSATGREVSVVNGRPDLNPQFGTWQRIGGVLARMGLLPAVAS